MKSLILAMSLYSLTACAIDPLDGEQIPTATDEPSRSTSGNAAAASVRISPAKVPGSSSKQETIEIPISVDLPDGVSAAGVLCTMSAQGRYAGSGHNTVTALVLCPIVENGIIINFQWYNYETGAFMRGANKAPCIDKSVCGKVDALDSFEVLDVIVCATVIKDGVGTAGNCVAVPPF